MATGANTTPLGRLNPAKIAPVSSSSSLLKPSYMVQQQQQHQQHQQQSHHQSQQQSHLQSHSRNHHQEEQHHHQQQLQQQQNHQQQQQQQMMMMKSASALSFKSMISAGPPPPPPPPPPPQPHHHQHHQHQTPLQSMATVAIPPPTVATPSMMVLCSPPPPPPPPPPPSSQSYGQSAAVAHLKRELYDNDSNSNDSDSAFERKRRRRSSRWATDDQEKALIPGMPPVLPNNLSKAQEKAYLLQLQIEELSRRLRVGDLGILPNPEDRSPSPEPIYNNEGKRLNTREYRTRKKLEDERHHLILQMFDVNPEFKPPSDYKPPIVRVNDKVMIPQEEHPDINFVGLLIGPRGNTLKSMEKDTGAKIIIRGKGSVKEGKVGRKDGQLLPGEDEPLHAYVTANNLESVQKAVERIKEIIRQGVEVPEGQNDLRRMQLRELALLNGTLRENEGQLRCSNCGASSHKSWQCPDKPNVTNTMICSSCGCAGHIAKDCRDRRMSMMGMSPQGFSSNAGGMMGFTTGGSIAAQEKSKIDEEYMSLMAELGEGPPPPGKTGSSAGNVGSSGGLFGGNHGMQRAIAAAPPPSAAMSNQSHSQPPPPALMSQSVQPPWNQAQGKSVVPPPPSGWGQQQQQQLPPQHGQYMGPPPGMLGQPPPPPGMQQPWMQQQQAAGMHGWPQQQQQQQQHPSPVLPPSHWAGFVGVPPPPPPPLPTAHGQQPGVELNALGGIPSFLSAAPPPPPPPPS